MPEHVHLIVHPRELSCDVAAIRKAIKAPVARRALPYFENESPEWLPRITRSRGSKVERLFWKSGGGYDRNVIETSTLMTMIEYLHWNPVRRNLVQQAGDWKWSSAAWFLEHGDSPLTLDRIPPEWLE